MRLLVLNDIHGNLPALEAVLRDPDALSADRIISTGDHTGFGPEPLAVHRRLRALNAVMLLGNHEERLLRAHEPSFSGYNWTLLQWTRQIMSGEDLTFLPRLQLGDALFVHAADGDVNRGFFNIQ